MDQVRVMMQQISSLEKELEEIKEQGKLQLLLRTVSILTPYLLGNRG